MRRSIILFFLIIYIIPITLCFGEKSERDINKMEKSAFMAIVNNPNSSEAEKLIIRELMQLVGEFDPAKAYSKLMELKSIVIYGGNIGGYKNISLTDITPLGDFYNLRELILVNNKITDLSPLSKLINLEILRIDNNKINDLTPMATLTSLKQLMLDNNEVTDISPLRTLKNLNYLSLRNNFIENVNGLEELNKLEKLYLSHNRIKDINPLSNLPLIFDLYLDQNKISNIISLGNIGSKQIGGITLNLSGNAINDIESLRNIKNLTILYLADNEITNIEPLTNAKLTILDLKNNQISNITPLLNVKTLKELNLMGNPIVENENLIKLNQKVPILHIDSKFSGYMHKIKTRNLKEINKLIGKWRSEETESEWGEVIVEIIFNEKGEYQQDFYFVGGHEKEPLTRQGTYHTENGTIVLETKTDRNVFRFSLQDDFLLLESESDESFGTSLKLKRVDVS